MYPTFMAWLFIWKNLTVYFYWKFVNFFQFFVLFFSSWVNIASFLSLLEILQSSWWCWSPTPGHPFRRRASCRHGPFQCLGRILWLRLFFVFLIIATYWKIIHFFSFFLTKWMPTLRSLEHDPDSDPKYVCKHCLLFCIDLLETQLEILARFCFGKFWEGRWGLLDPNRSWSPRWTPKSTAGRHTQCFRIFWLMVRFLGISPCWLVGQCFRKKLLLSFILLL